MKKSSKSSISVNSNNGIINDQDMGSEIGERNPSILPKNKFQMVFLKICENKYFQGLIIITIIMNTLVLGLDAYPIDYTL